MNNNTVVCLIIAALWAGAATVAFLLALHSRSKLNTENTRLRVKLGSAQDLAEKWRMEAARLREPAPKPAAAFQHLRQFILDNTPPKPVVPAKPSTARPSLQTPTHPSTSRSYNDDSSNALAAGVLGSTLWSGNFTPDTSSDSSSDSGSFSGGESGTF